MAQQGTLTVWQLLLQNNSSNFSLLLYTMCTHNYGGFPALYRA